MDRVLHPYTLSASQSSLMMRGMGGAMSDTRKEVKLLALAVCALLGCGQPLVWARLRRGVLSLLVHCRYRPLPMMPVLAPSFVRLFEGFLLTCLTLNVCDSQQPRAELCVPAAIWRSECLTARHRLASNGCSVRLQTLCQHLYYLRLRPVCSLARSQGRPTRREANGVAGQRPCLRVRRARKRRHRTGGAACYVGC